MPNALASEIKGVQSNKSTYEYDTQVHTHTYMRQYYLSRHASHACSPNQPCLSNSRPEASTPKIKTRGLDCRVESRGLQDKSFSCNSLHVLASGQAYTTSRVASQRRFLESFPVWVSKVRLFLP